MRSVMHRVCFDCGCVYERIFVGCHKPFRVQPCFEHRDEDETRLIGERVLKVVAE